MKCSDMYSGWFVIGLYLCTVYFFNSDSVGFFCHLLMMKKMQVLSCPVSAKLTRFAKETGY